MKIQKIRNVYKNKLKEKDEESKSQAEKMDWKLKEAQVLI